MSDKKVFVCSRALALSIWRAKALLQALITGHDITAVFRLMNYIKK